MSECLHEDCDSNTPHPRNVFCSHTCRKNHRYRTGRRLTNGVYHLSESCNKYQRHKGDRGATWNRIKYHDLRLCRECNPNVVKNGRGYRVIELDSIQYEHE